MKRIALLASFAVINLLAPACFADDSKPLGQSHEDYVKLFLDGKDLPAGMKNNQNSIDKGTDPGDENFTDLKGQRCGFKVWTHKDTNNPVWRVVDIRIVFPDADAAKKYMAGSMRSLSEGAPEDKDAPKVGDDCQVFKMASEMFGVEMRAYTYVFRKGNVVVKFFVAQGDGSKEKLDSQTVAALAEKVLNRLEDAGK